MKKFFTISLFGSFLLLGPNPGIADWTHYVTEGSKNGTDLYHYNSKNESKKYLSTIGPFVDGDGALGVVTDAYGLNNGNFWVEIDKEGTYTVFEYDLENDEWINKGKRWENAYRQVVEISLIKRDRDTGITSIGLNSLNFKEKGNELDLWGTNLDGEKVPVNVTSGLLIKGRDVEQSINNVGAMSAALTGLPTVPSDTKIACGLGTGTHGGDFALSGGCASKVNEKLSINYAASMAMPGQEYAGDFVDQFSARAGFVWQLGASKKPTQISMNQKKELDLKISNLEKDNQELKIKNNKIISQNKKLLARLEKLENIASKFQKNEGLKLSKGL